MPAILTHHAYGKSQVRLTKITRLADRHELKDLSVDIQLEGDFGASYTRGDNSRIIPTDTMKNTVYALAKNHPIPDPETFGQVLAGHFLENFLHVQRTTIHLVECPWHRIAIAGHGHPHAFIGGGNETRTTTVIQTRDTVRIESGLDGLVIVKTTDSAFSGFLRDRYTTLKAADDRILATTLTASWLYHEQSVDWNHAHHCIRESMLEAFAGHRSLSVQQTLHAMGETALDACPQVEQITLTMPNAHHLLVDLQPFGLENPNEIFVPTDEPFGLITATLSRGDA